MDEFSLQARSDLSDPYRNPRAIHFLLLDAIPPQTGFMKEPREGRLYDRPLRKDWLAWLSALVVFAGIAFPVTSEFMEPTPDPFDLALSLPFTLAIAWALLVLLPGVIRRLVRRNPPQRTGGLFDRPLWKDWLTWLTAYGFFAGLFGFRVLFGDPDSTGSSSAQLATGLVLSVAVSVGMFGLVPGLIRRQIRKRVASIVRAVKPEG
jgi:drug/metabolite transporter (DMT)-like permease